jgi:hypothetical protein
MKVLVNTDHVMRPTQFKGGFFFAIDAYSTRQIQKTPLNFYHILIYQFPGKNTVENSKFGFFFFFFYLQGLQILGNFSLMFDQLFHYAAHKY